MKIIPTSSRSAEVQALADRRKKNRALVSAARHGRGFALAAIFVLALELSSFSARAGTDVWRAQIVLQTADVTSAGTDDAISVSLKSGNSRQLDYSRDDFERGDVYTYDLSLDEIDNVTDITRVQISKTGSNGWCLKSYNLYLNGVSVCTGNWSSGLWLDNSSGHSTTMSRSLSLTSASSAVTTRINRADTKSLIEGIVGDAIHRYTDDNIDLGVVPVLWWDYDLGVRDLDIQIDWDSGSYISKKDSDELSVDLDLKAALNVDGVGDFTMDIKVSFDLKFSAADDEVTIESRNLDVDVNVYGAGLVTDIVLAVANLLSADLEEPIEDAIEDKLESELPNSSFDLGFTPSITIESDADVVFGL